MYMATKNAFIYPLPENERESASLALDAGYIHSLHGVHVELPDLQGPREVGVHVHGHEEALDGRGCTARNLCG